MIGNLYYFVGLFLFLVNLGLLMNFSKIQKTRDWINSFFKVAKRKPNNSEIDKDDYQRVNSFNQIFGINFLWIFFGLISNSWKFFLAVLIINFLLNVLLNFVRTYRLFNFFIEFVRLFFITVCIGFSVMNHFHLHIDIFQYLK